MLSETQFLVLPFKCRDQEGKIHVTVQPNQDANHAWGLDMIFPSVPPADFPRQFFGFPVIKGEVHYPVIPFSPSSGYRSLFGWIQFVKSTKEEGCGDWEMDIYPVFAKKSESPFTYWGHLPTLFDAPAVLLNEDGSGENSRWRAQSFLCVLEDGGMSKNVQICSGAGFKWGYDAVVRTGDDQDQARKIVVMQVEPLNVELEWNQRLGLLRELYPEWNFHKFKSD